MPLRLLTIVLLVALSDTAHAQNDSAYLDASARALVAKARATRQVADLSVEAYKALSKERISMGLRGIRRDRLLYRREVVGRLEWTRQGAGRIEVLGARESIPIATKGVQIPGDLTNFMPHLAFDPADNRMLLGWSDNDFVRHPLAPDAEDHYRYRTGSTTSLQLQDGRIVRLIELEIIARRADPQLINGSFWLDAQNHAVVQAAFRLARKFDVRKDGSDADDKGDPPPAWLGEMSAELQYVAIEYGLYDLRWWMPRLIAFEGHVKAGPLRMPLNYERSYAEYEISGSAETIAMPMEEVMRRDSVRRVQEEQCEGRMTVRATVGGGEKQTPADSVQRPQTGTCGRWQVVMSTDSSAILHSKLLPPDPYSDDEELLTEADLENLAERFKDMAHTSPALPVPELTFQPFDPGMLRYNRIEGLSFGGSASVDFGNYIANAEARVGVADLEPNFELAVQRPARNRTVTLGTYRRLNGTEPGRSPFTLGASLSSLLFGSDDADFYRSLGIELRGEPSGAAARWYRWRLYAQQERSAAVETHFSVRHLISSDHLFRPNIRADHEDAVGAELQLRYNRGLNPTGFRFGAELYGHAASGSTTFGRSALTLRFGIPLPGAFDMAMEYSAGTSLDSLPIQHNWYIGGSATLRGYTAATMIGDAFWRGRAEIGYGLPAIRLIGFTDLGWAGSRDEIDQSKPLLSVGGGVSVLDGILRFDVARGLRAPKGWAATLYFDAAL